MGKRLTNNRLSSRKGVAMTAANGSTPGTVQGRTMLVTMALFGLVILVAPSRDAEAAGHGHRRHHCHHRDNRSAFGLTFGTTTTRHYVPGRWEYRTEHVMVEPAHYEKVRVPAVYKEVVDKDNKVIKIKVHDGYMKEVYVPARYETVTTRHWVPGYYTTTTSSTPSVSLGFGFRF